MTKRETFAMAAIQGFCANSQYSPTEQQHFDNLATDSLKLTDTLLKNLGTK